ncbi:MAG TPA: hypothetical protein VFE46_20200, partial [Pirellulales bacterium]|nr:hypothetical protein [Pirellulales bacterium]
MQHNLQHRLPGVNFVDRHRSLIFGLALVIFAVLLGWIYRGTLRAPFVFDDAPSVETNSSIVRLWPLVGTGSWRGPLNPPRDLPTSGRPLVNLTL